eukprot:superscaffoldBa00003576_g17257
MSQWKQIQQLEIRLLEHVDYLYDDNFPMDIRQGLASWIESQDWDTAANDESMAAVQFNNLLSQLERVRSQEQNFLQRHNMKIIQQQLQVKYTTNPAVMARVISTCLREERRILSSACMQEQSLFQIKRQLDKLGELVLKVTYESDPIPLQKPQMEDRVKYLIYHLIKSSFVVEKQPCMPTHPQKPLIIKTGVQFTTKVRLLVKLPEVDYQLKVKTTFDKSRQFFILTNNTKVMDIEDYSNGCLSVEFRHLVRQPNRRLILFTLTDTKR